MEQPWKVLAKRIREVNEANGWERPSWEKLPIKLMLIVTEDEEASQAVDGTGEHPLPEELADIGVRLLDILEAMWSGEWSLRVVRLEPSFRDGYFRPIEVALRPIRKRLCEATEFWRKDNRGDARIALEFGFAELTALCMDLGINLHTEMQLKTEKNATRGHLHGKKRADG